MKETGSEKERAVFEAAVESWVRSHLNSQSSAVCIPHLTFTCFTLLPSGASLNTCQFIVQKLRRGWPEVHRKP